MVAARRSTSARRSAARDRRWSRLYVLVTPVLVLVGAGARAHRAARDWPDCRRRPARPLRGGVRRHLGGQQQRLRLRRAHLRHAVLEHPARALHARSAGSCRSCSCSPSPGRFAAPARPPPAPGTLPTHRPLFVGLLAGVALVVVGLTFVPVLALGPIVESLS